MKKHVAFLFAFALLVITVIVTTSVFAIPAPEGQFYHLNCFEVENTPDGFYYDPVEGAKSYCAEVLWGKNDDIPQIFVVGYDGGGRLTSCEKIATGEGDTWCYIGFSCYPNCTKKVFLLDPADLSPLVPPAVVTNEQLLPPRTDP